MLILVHSAPSTLARYRHPNLGVLSSPDRYYRDVLDWPWAADNGAYSGFDALQYRQMLAEIDQLWGCRFVTLPDVVGDAAATLLLAYDWWREVNRHNLPIALVAQDGLTLRSTPWGQIDALFVGGSSKFKMGEQARELVAEARERGLWVHMGRVNSHQRLRYAKAIGCDSVDGTSFSWFKDRWLRDFLAHAAAPPQELLA